MGLLITIDYHNPGAPVVVLAGTAGSDLVANLGATLSDLATHPTDGLIVDLTGLRRRDRVNLVKHLAELTIGPLLVVDPDHQPADDRHEGCKVAMAGSVLAAQAALRRLGPPSVSGDTVLEVLDALAEHRWRADFHPTPDAGVRCGTCHRTTPADQAPVGQLHRFDHDTDPASQSVVVELACPRCGAIGTMVCAYGPTAGPDDTTVLASLNRPLTPERRTP